MLTRSRLSWLLAIAGALLLAKGSFSVYPFLFPSNVAEVVIVNAMTSDSDLRPGEPLFELSLPSINASFIIVEGTTEASLRKGPGHLEGSPLPGESGNAVIAGHRDTHFRVLKDVLIGDEIRVGVGENEYTYRIVDIRVVPPTDTHVLRPPQSGSILTLITCYPFRFVGAAPERYVVQAKLFDTSL